MRRFFLRNTVRDTQQDVADEVRFHLDMRTEEMMSKGLSNEEARLRTVESFGDVAAVEAECRTVRDERNREHRRREWRHDLISDARFALRTLRRSPIFALTAVLTLALGIGGAVGGFTLVNGVLLRPLPYHEPSRLAMIWMTGRSNGVNELQWPLSIPNFLDLKASVRTVSGIAAFRAWPYALRGDGGPSASEIVPSARVSPELFGVLGVQPQLGRAFTESDEKIGSAPVTIISADLWRRRFGAAHDVIGKRVVLSGTDFTIVGVMPAGFAFPRGAELPGGFQFAPRTELWTPLVISEQDLAQRGTGNIAVVARLAASATFGSVTGDFARVLKQIQTTYPRYFLPNTGIAATAMSEQVAAPVRRGLWLLLAAVTVVLLIACVNIANLLLARAAGREHELTVRRALGASGSRVVQQLVTENVLLATTGAALGFALAVVVTRVLVTRIPTGLPRADDVVVDWRVVIATLLIALLAGVAFGAVTSFNGSGNSADVVRGGVRATGGRTQRFGRRAIVVVEVSLSLVLLVGAGLLVQSYRQLSRVSPGFESSGAMTASVLLPIAGSFDQQHDGPQWTQFFTDYERRLNESPAVEAAGGISSLPLSGAVESTGYTVDGDPPLADGVPRPSADYQVITSGWFRAARVPIVAGRAFDSRDSREGDAAIIVSAALAHAQWPREPLTSVVGRRLRTGLSRTPQTIVGIAGDIRQTGLDIPFKPVVYLPEAQFPYPFLNFVVRAKNSANPASVLPTMREELRAINPTLALDALHSLQEVFDTSIARQRFGMMVTGAFAGAALFLAMIGLYGVIATGVAERTREIGVRIALGATRGNVLTAVMKEGVSVTLLGVLCGTAAAWAAARLLRDQLYGVSATSVPIYAGVVIVTAVVALGATIIPAMRATKLNPVSALRGE